MSVRQIFERRYPVWLTAIVGFVIGFGVVYMNNPDAKDAGEAFGFAVLPGLFGAVVFGFLAKRQNAKIDMVGKV